MRSVVTLVMVTWVVGIVSAIPTGAEPLIGEGMGLPDTHIAPREARPGPIMIPSKPSVNLRTLRAWIDHMSQHPATLEVADCLVIDDALLMILEDIQERLDMLEQGQDTTP